MEIILKNNFKLNIKKATEEEAEKIVEYVNLVGGESDNLTFGKDEFHMTVDEEREFIKNLNKTKSSAMFLGKINDEIVCMGNIISHSKERIKHQSTIGISVKKKYWSMGIGTILMEELIKFAKETNIIKIISLEVLTENENAIKIYKKLGFEEIGIYKNFFFVNNKYKDALLMNLYL